jgi:hypothetical protein
VCRARASRKPLDGSGPAADADDDSSTGTAAATAADFLSFGIPLVFFFSRDRQRFFCRTSRLPENERLA